MSELLAQIIGEVAFGRLGRSEKAQLLFRIFFGLIGAVLGVIGAVHFAGKAGLPANQAMRASIVVMFVFVACFSLFNVVLRRPWRWPAIGFGIAFVSMFVTRIALGP